MISKTLIIFATIALSIVAAVAQENSFRIYDVQGRSLEAKLLQVDNRRGMVELELRNTQRKKVKVSIFSKADQEYFRDWHVVQEFQSARLKIEAKKKIVNSRMEMVQGAVRRDIDEICYEITVNNRTEISIGDITVEYNIYAEQQVLDHVWNQFTTVNTYNGIGAVTKVADGANHIWWEIDEADFDAKGHLLEYTLGNDVVTSHGYDAGSGRLDEIRLANLASGMHIHGFQHDNVGNLDRRTLSRTMKANLAEDFTYDSLNRLRTETVGTVRKTIRRN